MNVQVETDLASGAAPELLIPGDVAGYLLVAQTLRAHARLLEGTGDCLSRIEVTNWRGQASTGFLHVIAVEPGRWRTAADAFTAAADALEGFLACLTPAREQARHARQLYQQYQALLATAAALAGVPSALPGPAPTDAVMSVQDRMRIGARYQQMSAIAAGGALRGPAFPAAPDPVATVYAADTMRRQAITLLDQARRAVDAAGTIAADALTTAMEQAPAARRLTQATIRPAAITDTGHTALDTAGLLPGIGELADTANSFWYLSDGDTLNAAISAVGTLPLLGNAVTGGRMVKGGKAAVNRAAEASLRQLNDGGLIAHELPPKFHTIARHAGLSQADLLARVSPPNSIRVASTFASQAEAETYTYAAITGHAAEIEAWVKSGATGRLRLKTHFDHPVGKSMYDSTPGVLHDSWSVTTVLKADSTMPNGYRIQTSYPA